MAFFKNKPGEDYGAVNRTEKQMENIRFNAATNWKWNESYMLKWLQEYTWEMLWSTSFQHERYAEFTTARHETFSILFWEWCLWSKVGMLMLNEIASRRVHVILTSVMEQTNKWLSWINEIYLAMW